MPFLDPDPGKFDRIAPTPLFDKALNLIFDNPRSYSVNKPSWTNCYRNDRFRVGALIDEGPQQVEIRCSTLRCCVASAERC